MEKVCRSIYLAQHNAQHTATTCVLENVRDSAYIHISFQVFLLSPLLLSLTKIYIEY